MHWMYECMVWCLIYWLALKFILDIVGCKIHNSLQTSMTKMSGGDRSEPWRLPKLSLGWYSDSLTGSGPTFVRVKHTQWLPCTNPPMQLGCTRLHSMLYRLTELYEADFCLTLQHVSTSLPAAHSMALPSLLSDQFTPSWGFFTLSCQVVMWLTLFSPPHLRWPSPSPPLFSFAFLPPKCEDCDNWTKVCGCTWW